jgi:hypothetical protein
MGEPVTGSVRLRPKPPNSPFNTISDPTNTTLDQWLLIPKEDRSLEAVRDRLSKAGLVKSENIEARGRFEFLKVYPGTYVLEIATTGGTLLEREIQVGIEGLENVALQVPAIHLTGRVIAPSGGPLPKLNYVRLVRSGKDSDVFYGFPDAEGRFSLLLVSGEYRVFTERLGTSVESVSYDSRDVTNTEFTIEGGRNQQIVVTLQP